MNISFLTTEDPLYLPAFFDRVLPDLGRSHVLRVYSVPPLYKNQAPVQAAWRYFRTFGAAATIHLIAHIFRARFRGQSIQSTCLHQRVPYQIVSDVNTSGFLGQLRQEQTQLLVSVSCPQIFQSHLIELPPRGILNLHGAILPQYRGVMPSFWMLANREQRAGVSIYFVNEKIDAGELCGQEVFPVEVDETLDQFIRRSKRIAAELLLRTVDALDRGSLQRRPLDLAAGSYYSWPDAAAVTRFRAAGRRLW